MEEFETKEITLVKQKAGEIISEIDGIKITTAPQLEYAVNLLSRITDIQKMVKEKKESITKPLNEGLRNIRDFFAPVENRLESSGKDLREKMLDYKEKVEVKVQQQKEQIAQKVESGEVGFDKGSKQMEKVDNKIRAIPTRKIREIQIMDEGKIPEKYWELNMITLRRDALAGIEIPGVKVVEREIIVSK